ncbi:MAG: ABC transporter ATP-binding protein/permease [Patescibacteria group bacterium]
MEKLPPKLQQKESAKDTRPIPLSKQTNGASEQISDVIKQGKFPTTQDVTSLISSVEHDISKAGITLNDQEKKKFEESVKKTFEKPQNTPLNPDDAKQFEVSLPEYQKLFTQLSKTYGMDKQKIKFGAIEGLIMTSKTVQSLSSVSLSGIILSVWNNQASLPKSSELAWRWLGERMAPNVREATTTGSMPIKVNEKHILDASDEMGAIWKTLKWPAAVALAYIPAVVGEYAGQVSLINAMKPVRRAVNERAANSLFMRDMEFVHDKSAAEINNIIEKGKQSTIELFQTTYSDVIPRLAVIGLGTLGQIPLGNPVGALLQLARLPFLYGASKEYASGVLAQRASDLKRKDMIDTRINATLGSLEIVKTSDSMDKAIGQLKDNMTMRDEFQMTSSKESMKQGVKMEAINAVFGIGVPVLTAGLEYFRTGRWQKAAQSGITGGFGGALVEGNSRELIDIYIDKIQPALQDVKRMEELLGPYESLDKPDGPLEKHRMPVGNLKNFDISVRNLSYKNILHHVSLDVPQGAFVTLKGASGSGKTTLMRHMLGLFGADEAAVTYGGTDMQKIKKFGDESIYSAIGYANQNPQFFENMTLRDNLLLWTKKLVREEKITSVLQDLRLDHVVDRLDSTVKHFSGGELRRIGIARAILKDPKVLFLDEPTANLDEESAKQVLEIVRNMRKSRPDMTVVAVTHDPNFEAIAEKIIDFAKVNTPADTKAESLGNRQIFYAASASSSKN